jgi:hypothetical protein
MAFFIEGNEQKKDAVNDNPDKDRPPHSKVRPNILIQHHSRSSDLISFSILRTIRL